ncbi:MAG: serine hydrolase domain-containing protein [Bacteroidota bacterium]
MHKTLLFSLILFIGINVHGQSLDQAISEFVKQHHFNGNIHVVQGDSVMFSSSFGLANIEFEVSNEINTRFRIASVTKLFTSVLIYQLVEQKKIKLDGTISNYLPSYTGEGKGEVTIHQLLTSTSGIEDLEKNGDEVYEKRLTSDQILNEYCSGALQSKPGSRFNYNNADFIILGKILEEIYEKDYTEILTDNILKPLEMNDTGLMNYEPVKYLSQCYWYNEEAGKLENDIPSFVENYYASGAMYSSVSDLLKFSDALYDHQLISEKVLNTLLTPQNGVEDSDNYASGLWVYEFDVPNGSKHKAASRQGNIWGAEAMLLKIFDKEITIVILSNNIGDVGMWDLIWTIKRAVYG